MDYFQIIEAFKRPAQALGVVPELAAVRPQINVRLYHSLASTNQEAWRLIDQESCGAGTAVIAQQQSAGRGQWGRQWISAAGGLYLSLILEPEMAIAEATLLTLASAWGIATCLENLGVDLQIKWPNDLISQGRKIGGILTESRIRPHREATVEPQRQIQHAVVGVGLNWDNPLPPNAISVRQLLPDPATRAVKDLESLAAIALRGILQGYYYYQLKGADALIQVYQQKLFHLGKDVSMNGYPAVVTGVTHTGELVLEIHNGEQKTTQSLKPGEISLGYNV